MFKNIENKKIDIKYVDEKVKLSEEVETKIQKHWEKVSSKNSGIWNGEIVLVSNYYENENEVIILCQKTDYAHYLYHERVKLPIEYACCNLSGGCLLETLDGYYIVGELDKNTSFPYCMQITGGNINKDDIEKNEIDIKNTIRRECREEINIDIEDVELVKNYRIKYINVPDNGEHGYEVFAKADLNMTSEEMQKYYDEYLKYLRENKLEVEFGKIHFIPRDRAIESLKEFNNPKRKYLELLLREESNKECTMKLEGDGR